MLFHQLPDEALALVPRIGRVPALEAGHLRGRAVRHELRHVGRLEPAQQHRSPASSVKPSSGMTAPSVAPGARVYVTRGRAHGRGCGELCRVRSRLALLAVMSAGLMAAACGGPAAPRAPAPAPATTTVPPAAARSRADLVVPPGEGGGAFAAPRTLTVPPGWTARVWARVPDARMEAWTPEGDLLVSQPALGRIVELTPGPHGTAAPHVLLAGLTLPQGLAFARVAGHWVSTSGSRTRSTGTRGTRRDRRGPHRHRSPPARRRAGRRRRPPAQGRGRRPGRRRVFRRGQLVQRQPRRPDVLAAAGGDHGREPGRQRPARGGEGGAQRRGPGGGPRRLGVDRGQQP